jgi:hypothetical protein
MLVKIVLIAVLVVLAVVLAVAVLAVTWLRRVVRSAAGGSKLGILPARVSLLPEPNPQWHDSATINNYAAQLRALGFEDAGAFSIPEMGGLMVLGLVHPRDGLASIIYDHKNRPISFEILEDFTDGSSVTATSSSIGSALDKRPNNPILWLGTTNAREILQAVQDHAASAPRKPIAKTEFVDRFKAGYARSVNWRLKKGGASRDEIRRHAEKKGRTLTDEQIEQSYRNLRVGYLKNLQSGCIAQFLDDQKPSANEWERIRTQTFAIAETLELNELVETISEHTSLDAEQRHQLGKVAKNFGEDAVAVMRRILDQDIASLGLELLAEVKEPVAALILQAPASIRRRGPQVLEPALKSP